MSVDRQPAKHNQFLTDLPPRERELLRPHLRYFELKLGERLQRAGEPIANVVFPITGAISVTKPLGGLNIQCSMVGREGLMGGWADPADGHSPYDAVVHIGGAALHVPFATFHTVVNTSGELRTRVMRENLLEVGRITQTIACNAVHSTESRVCRWLLELHDRCGNGRFSMTQEMLAGMLGVQRTTVTAVAGRLQAEGAIEWGRGKIAVFARDILASHACECYRGAFAKAPTEDSGAQVGSSVRDEEAPLVLQAASGVRVDAGCD